MTTFTGLRCSELSYIPRGAAPFSRSQLYLPGKLSFGRARIDSGGHVSCSSRQVSPILLAAEEEARAALTLFLKKQGLSDAVTSRTINKSGLFIGHLVSRLHSVHKSPNQAGQELTTLEIRDIIFPYLESLLEKHGGLLTDVVENFQHLLAEGKPTVPVYATPQYQMYEKKLKAVRRIRETGPDGTLQPNIMYLMELGLDLDHIEAMTRVYPSFPSLSVERKIRPVVEFLRELGVPKSDLPFILSRYPNLCGFRLSEKLMPTQAFLESLGVEKKDWAKVIRRYPKVLGLSRQKFEATVDFLYDMGVSPESLGRILTNCPHIAGFSVEGNLRPTAEYFLSLGVDVAVLLRRHPSTFGLSIENHLKPITAFFMERGYSIQEIGTLFTRFGYVLSYSLAGNLSPKWDYFMTLNYTREELLRYPYYFGFSLEERIKPRFALVKEYGLKLTLRQVLSPSDQKFETTLKRETMKLHMLNR